jgi:hypothetical protein
MRALGQASPTITLPGHSLHDGLKRAACGWRGRPFLEWAGKPKVCFNDGTIVEQPQPSYSTLTYRYVTKWFTKRDNYAILARDNR